MLPLGGWPVGFKSNPGSQHILEAKSYITCCWRWHRKHLFLLSWLLQRRQWISQTFTHLLMVAKGVNILGARVCAHCRAGGRETLQVFIVHRRAELTKTCPASTWELLEEKRRILGACLYSAIYWSICSWLGYLRRGGRHTVQEGNSHFSTLILWPCSTQHPLPS